MMKNRPGEKIKLASLDELLGVVNEESAMEIEINKIHAFKNHPFKVLDDEKMQDLIESVKLSGVLTPVLLRVDSNDEYEMISGHRRLHAAKMAGLTTIPAIVRKLSDDDAVIAIEDCFQCIVFEYRLCASGAIQFGSNIGMPFCFCHAFQIIIHDNSLAERFVDA